jgi:hypothetical protein
MNQSHSFRWPIAVLVLFLLVPSLSLQAQEEYQPTVGQHGKDVVWVPTQQDLVDRMLQMAKVTAKDYVIDLGSGDGRTVISAAKLGATASGIEYNHDMVELSKRNAAAAGVSEKATFVEADLFESDFSKATVVTMFLLPEINRKLRPKILDLKPGTRIVSNTFDMGDWEADSVTRVEGSCISWCTASLWLVPAKVEGTWSLSEGTLTLVQQYQKVSGTLTLTGKEIPINGKLAGDQITFNAGASEYTGRVNSGTISGTVKSGLTNNNWSAKAVCGAQSTSCSD